MDDIQRRRFYRTAAWLRARDAALARDNYLCQACLRRHKLTAANTVHHKIPLEERPDLALELGNLESLCERCHNLAHPEKGFGSKGLRKHISVILGDGGAGQARLLMGEYDVLLDTGALCEAMGGSPNAPAIAGDMVDHALQNIRAKSYSFDVLWVTVRQLTDEQVATLRAARASFYSVEDGQLKRLSRSVLSA